MPDNRAYDEWEGAVRDFLLVKDKHIIKLIPILLVTHDLVGDPVWSFLVAPPGGSKSEFIKAMNNIPHVTCISTLTSKTFASGARMAGKEASLLLREQDGYFSFEDFTTVLSEHQEEVKGIFGQLRSIYGGTYDKEFGNGMNVNWRGKFTLIAGATYAIHAKRMLFSSMGERFLIYNIQQPEREEVTLAAIRNHQSEDLLKMRDRMGTTLVTLKEQLTVPKDLPRLTEDMEKLVVRIAEFSTRARSTIERDYSSQKKEIIEINPPEMPTRLAAQFVKILQAAMVVNHYRTGKYSVLDEDIELIKRIGIDCISPVRRLVLVELAKYEMTSTAALAVKLNLATETTRRFLEDFNALKIVDRSKKGREDQWMMRHIYREIVSSIEHIEITTEELTESGAYEEMGIAPPAHVGYDDDEEAAAQADFDSLGAPSNLENN